MLVKAYLEATGKATPEASLKLEEFINLGYQRLLNFEVAGGGFDWFGNPPANIMLSAYGVQEFTDMARVYPVDGAVIDRATAWLESKQSSDGSWRQDAALPHTLRLSGGAEALTAFTAWALATAERSPAAVDRALSWLRGRLDAVDGDYVRALAANALLAVDPRDARGRELLDALAATAQVADGAAHWEGAEGTLCFGGGEAGRVEVTALAALALSRAGTHPGLLEQSLTWLLRAKTPLGAWPGTQATILAMKALVAGTTAVASAGDAAVDVVLDGRSVARVEIPVADADIVRRVDLGPHLREPGTHSLELAATGDLRLTWQVSGRDYLPREAAPAVAAPSLDLAVEYDRTRLEADQVLGARVRVRNLTAEPLFMVIVDLGVPPGFTPERSSLEALIAGGKIAKFQLTGRQVTCYLENLPPGETLLPWSLRARYPVSVQAPPTTAWEYYAPERRTEVPGQRLEVTAK